VQRAAKHLAWRSSEQRLRASAFLGGHDDFY
jgi:uncharacterized membrane protein YsdA (DUF1294 family)